MNLLESKSNSPRSEEKIYANLYDSYSRNWHDPAQSFLAENSVMTQNSADPSLKAAYPQQKADTEYSEVDMLAQLLHVMSNPSQ